MSQESREETITRYLAQVAGKVERTYSEGKMGPTDKGDLSAALLVDKEHRRLIVSFGTSVEWIDMTADEAVLFAEQLLLRAEELQALLQVGGGS